MGKASRRQRSPLTFFVQACRTELRRRHPEAAVSGDALSRACAQRWQSTSAQERALFEHLARGWRGAFKTRPSRDPLAPKRPLSAFFIFSSEQRPQVRARWPGLNYAETAKRLGEHWAALSREERQPFEVRAAVLRQNYRAALAVYQRQGGLGGDGSAPKKGKAGPQREENNEGQRAEPHSKVYGHASPALGGSLEGHSRWTVPKEEAEGGEGHAMGIMPQKVAEGGEGHTMWTVPKEEVEGGEGHAMGIMPKEEAEDGEGHTIWTMPKEEAEGGVWQSGGMVPKEEAEGDERYSRWTMPMEEAEDGKGHNMRTVLKEEATGSEEYIRGALPKEEAEDGEGYIIGTMPREAAEGYPLPQHPLLGPPLDELKEEQSEEVAKDDVPHFWVRSGGQLSRMKFV